MKYFLLLQAVLVLTIASANDNGPHDDDFDDILESIGLSMTLDMDYPGDDLENMQCPDDNYCQLLCSFHSQCTHFTFMADSFTCYIKHVEEEQVKDLKMVDKPGAVCGLTIPPAHVSKFQCYDEMFPGIDFPGNDFLILMRNTPEECMDACTRYEDCQFFTLDTEKKRCYMKVYTKLPNPPTIRILNNVTSGFSMRDCNADEICDKECTDLLLDHTDFPGHDMGMVMTPDVDRCQLVCNDLPGCHFFTFCSEDFPDVSRRFSCYLKTSASQMPSRVEDLQHAYSGSSLRTIRSHKSCSSEVYEDLDFPGNDQRKVKVDSWQACQEQCTYDYLCQYFTYVEEDFENTELRGNCYMKNVLALPTPPVVTKRDNRVSGYSQEKCTEKLYTVYEDDDDDDDDDDQQIQA